MVPMGHLTCVGHTREELAAILDAFADAGVPTCWRCAATRQAGPARRGRRHRGRPHLRQRAGRAGRRSPVLSVGVAALPEGHREAASLDHDVGCCRPKQDAGAEFAITEMFFRASRLLRPARARRGPRGVDIPILPGIMPITNLGQIRRMAELSGRDVPAEVVERVAGHEGDPEAVRAAGIEVASELCEALLDCGAPGLHFYTLNRSKATREIYANLRLPVS